MSSPPDRLRCRGTYVASRAQIAPKWRRLRDVDGYKITSTWIDKIGSQDWTCVEREIAVSDRLILYVEPWDMPPRDSLVTVGIAIAHRIPIWVVSTEAEQPGMPWIDHPLVTYCRTVDEALSGAALNM